MKKLLLGLMLCTSMMSMAETYVKVYHLDKSFSYDTRRIMNEKIINDAIKEEYDRHKAKAIGISMGIGSYYEVTAYILFEK